HVLYGVGVDLLEQREAVALVVAMMEQPVLRLALGVKEALAGHVGGARGCERGGDQQRTREGAGKRFRPHPILLTISAEHGPAFRSFCVAPSFPPRRAGREGWGMRLRIAPAVVSLQAEHVQHRSG